MRKKPVRGGIPFMAVALGDGSPEARARFERNARLKLEEIECLLNLPPEKLKRPLDLKKTLDMKGLLERYLANPIHAATRDAQYLRDRLAAFGPRTDSTSASTEYVRKLRAENPALKAKELRKLADPKKLGSMDAGTFRNIAGGARQK